MNNRKGVAAPFKISKDIFFGVFFLFCAAFFMVEGSICIAEDGVNSAGLQNKNEDPLLLCSATETDQNPAGQGEIIARNEIYDPLEPLNRAFFEFNDRLYFWVLKPISRGYKWVVPEPLRKGVKNFFVNILMPVRAVNCLLQGKPRRFGNELARFFINSTAGVGGLGDPAGKALKFEIYEEDLGQTLGVYGAGPGFFINWPVLGPSSVRDTLGLVGDSFLNPLNYILDSTKYNLAARGVKTVNSTSFRIGEYEALKEAAFDPYVSLRNAYHQNRQYEIRK